VPQGYEPYHFEGGPDASLKAGAALESRLQPLIKAGSVMAVQGLSPILPSLAEQAENQRRWEQIWSDENKARLRPMLLAAAKESHFKPGLLAASLDGLPGVIAPATPQGLSRGLLAQPIQNQLVVDGRGALLISNVALRSPKDLPALEAAVKGLPGASVLSGRRFMEHMVGLIYGEFLLLGGIAFVLNLLLLWLNNRDWKASLRIMAPLLACLLWVFGILGYAGIAVNMMGSLVLLFVFGLVVDYAIFLSAAWRQHGAGLKDHLANTGEVVTLSAATNLLALGALAFAHHPVLVFLGLTSIIGIGGGWVATLLLLPWIAGE